MKPPALLYNMLHTDRLTIEHLASTGNVIIWISKELALDVGYGRVVIQGKSTRNGFLPIRVIKNGTMIYPKPKSCAIMGGVPVSIEFRNVMLDRVTETFYCDDREKDRILYRRYKAARMYSINKETKNHFWRLMCDISNKWLGSL